MKKLFAYILLVLTLSAMGAAAFGQSRTQAGLFANGADQTDVIRPKIKSNTRLFISAGTYDLKQRINASGLTNVWFEGEPGTVIRVSVPLWLNLSGNNSKIKFTGIRFICTDTSPWENSEGIITNNNLAGMDGTLDGFTFDNCEINKALSNGNGIKINAEGTGLAKNITITNCRFIGIGRFAVETQNHVESDKIQRVQNITVENCYFQDIGTMGTWGLAVSISGYSYNAKVNNNTIVDVGWSKGKTQWDYYAIENAGCSKWQSNNNTIISRRYGFKGILCSNERFKEDVQIIGNYFELRGEKCNAVEMNNVTKAVVSGNRGDVDGLAFLLNNVDNSTFTRNEITSNYPAAYMLQQGSSGNRFSWNLADNSRSGEKWGVILFMDKGTEGNTFDNMTVIGGGYGNLNGATQKL